MTSHLEATLIRMAASPSRNGARRGRSQILIPPPLATLMVLRTLKLISGISKERLETKLMMISLSGGIVEPYRFEPCARDSEEKGGSVFEIENAGHMTTSAR